jgi:glycosyltransferase involved in cell wall biosynthesis
VPVALAEVESLDCFITDYYFGRLERILARLLPARLSEKLRRRFDPGIPADRVTRLRLTAAAEAIARAMGCPSSEIFDRFDPRYGEVAAVAARRRRSDLLIYSSYAWTAFNATYNYSPRKILFQFHPHYALEASILEADRLASAKVGIAFACGIESLGDRADGDRRRGDSAWQLAHHVVCASSFTRRSLVEAGAARDCISVAPYGVAYEATALLDDMPQPDEAFHALFVGSGVQRKGLHHLLLAWQRAHLPAGACLTIVARKVDPGLLPLLRSVPRTRLLPRVSDAELHRLYSKATLFVMPSLIEGFGQVYLEALSHGLPVLGTINTGCPDIGTESNGINLTTPGNIDELAAKIETLARSLPGDLEVRQRARDCSRRFSWVGFRKRIQSIISDV